MVSRGSSKWQHAEVILRRVGHVRPLIMKGLLPGGDSNE